MQPTYFIGLNGPPRVGKDSLALAAERDHWMHTNFLVHRVSYARPLKAAVHTLFGEDYTEENKDLPTIYGPTPRQFYIGMSETYAKKVTDNKAIFGHIMVVHMQNSMRSSKKPTLFLATDCGFEDEQYPVQEYIGHQNFKMVQIHREDHDFSRDSRGYIMPAGSQTLTYYNHAPTLVEAQEDFVAHLKLCIQDWGWVS